MSQVFNNIGFSHGGQTSFLSPPTSNSSTTGFKPLPVVEIPLHASAATAVDINAADGGEAGDAPSVRLSGKLTVCVVIVILILVGF